MYWNAGLLFILKKNCYYIVVLGILLAATNQISAVFCAYFPFYTPLFDFLGVTTFWVIQQSFENHDAVLMFVYLALHSCF